MRNARPMILGTGLPEPPRKDLTTRECGGVSRSTPWQRLQGPGPGPALPSGSLLGWGAEAGGSLEIDLIFELTVPELKAGFN